ncbi:MAG: AAA family ATPase [Candidatus Micrarchaeales archaeon]|nr:AAA family ATPase [Candidatus Micrarchaeales archaeon]
MDRLIIAITGTPGAGKSTLAKEFANEIPNSRVIEINDIVNKYKLYSGRDKFGTKIVRLGALTAALKKEIRKSIGMTIFVTGHLAPELRLHYAVAIVKRSGLETLARRMEERRYPNEKIRDNLIAEATDYCGGKISRMCGETYEVESASDIKRVKNYIAALAEGKSAKKPRKREINKLNDLLKLVKKGNRYGL